MNLRLYLTFLHHTPPPLGPVTQLQSVALLYLCPLLKATDHLITQPMPVIYPLHCPFIVPWLQRKKAHNKIHFLILYLLVCLATVSYQQANISDELIKTEMRMKYKKSERCCVIYFPDGGP